MADIQQMDEALKAAGDPLLKRILKYSKRHFVFLPSWRLKVFSRAVRAWKDALNR